MYELNVQEAELGTGHAPPSGMTIVGTRTCDTCEAVIPHGTPYRSGWATVEALIELLAGSRSNPPRLRA